MQVGVDGKRGGGVGDVACRDGERWMRDQSHDKDLP